MIAPLLVAAIALPFLLVLWLTAWLVGDLFAGREPAVIPVRSDDWRR